MFNACVQVFGVFTNDYQINVIIAADDTGISFGRAYVCIQVENFTHRYVDTAETSANRCGNRAFQRNAVSADRFDGFTGDQSNFI